MKAKKYRDGGKVTKKMVDKEFAHNFEVDANLTNSLAKQASTGLKKNGFPMSPENLAALKKEVARRKKSEGKRKPNYKYVGTDLPSERTPSFEDGGKLTAEEKKALKEKTRKILMGGSKGKKKTEGKKSDIMDLYRRGFFGK